MNMKLASIRIVNVIDEVILPFITKLFLQGMHFSNFVVFRLPVKTNRYSNRKIVKFECFTMQYGVFSRLQSHFLLPPALVILSFLLFQ